MDPLVRLRRTVAVAQSGKPPGVLQRVPEVENLATAHEPCGAIPDPFGPVPYDHYHRLPRIQPAQFPYLGIEPMEDGVGIAQTTNQKAPYHRTASRRDLDAFFRQEQNPGLYFAEMAVLHGGQRS